jgi:hypothetical protein
MAGFAAGSAAETFRGTQGPDRLIGGRQPDVLLGFGGNDYLEGRRGDDLLSGGPGRDALFGGSGADRLATEADSTRDRVACGLGRDVLDADLADAVARDCEVVSRQLSHDPFGEGEAEQGTEVEPDSFARGRVVVAVFQVSRFPDGGALAIGYSTSRNAGRTWRSGLLPGLSRATRPAGAAEYVSDSSVGYDAAHRVWLTAALAGLRAADAVLVSRSRDGVSWRAPVTAFMGRTETIDKPWIACDNWPESPFRGRCYLSYLDTRWGEIAIRTSVDGGATWSAPVTAASAGNGTELLNGAQPLPRPDGSLLVPYTSIAAVPVAREDEIVVVRSDDGGASFGASRHVSVLGGWSIRDLRAPQFVSGDVDASGTVYLAWQGCNAAAGCLSNAIVLSRSADGVTWSRANAVPTTAGPLEVDSFVPGLAVAPGTSGLQARLALAYHTVTSCSGIGECERVDVGLVTSADGGRSWTAPQRLNAEPMRLSWLAHTILGRMTGDYISTSFARGRPIPVFALASPPTGHKLNEAIFATTRLPG